MNAVLTAMLILIVAGQSSLAGTAAFFPAVLVGGSKGVPSNLSGTISFSDNRIEFEAFPQVEYVELPCATIKKISLARANKDVITIVSGDVTYRFDLRAGSQSQRFVGIVTSSCQILSKGLPGMK